jgi:hypothetical protein
MKIEFDPTLCPSFKLKQKQLLAELKKHVKYPCENYVPKEKEQ